MDYIIKDWEKKMSAFESSVEKDLKEIRKCKADIQQMRNEIQREKQGNYFVRDAQRIILSALSWAMSILTVCSTTGLPRRLYSGVPMSIWRPQAMAAGWRREPPASGR